MVLPVTDLTRPCGNCGHPWNAHHFDSYVTKAGVFCSRYSNGGDPCEKGCPGFKELDEELAKSLCEIVGCERKRWPPLLRCLECLRGTKEHAWTPLSKADEYDDVTWVAGWTDGGGIEIESPGCGIAQLIDEQAKVLLRWLMDRYGAEKGWLPR